MALALHKTEMRTNLHGNELSGRRRSTIDRNNTQSGIATMSNACMRRAHPSARDAEIFLIHLILLVLLFGRRIHGSMHFRFALIALPKTQRLSLFSPDDGHFVLSMSSRWPAVPLPIHGQMDFFFKFIGIGLSLCLFGWHSMKYWMQTTSATTNKMCAKTSRRSISADAPMEIIMNIRENVKPMWKQSRDAGGKKPRQQSPIIYVGLFSCGSCNYVVAVHFFLSGGSQCCHCYRCCSLCAANFLSYRAYCLCRIVIAVAICYFLQRSFDSPPSPPVFLLISMRLVVFVGVVTMTT